MRPKTSTRTTNKNTILNVVKREQGYKELTAKEKQKDAKKKNQRREEKKNNVECSA